MPYLWRRLTPEQQQVILQHRKHLKRPWHRPPHFDQGNVFYHLTGACFEHQPFIGHSPERMAEFSKLLLDTLPESPAAWCVLPNHYHVLIRCADIKSVGRMLGKLQGSTSFRWNGEENQRGRKIWHSVSDRAMRNTEHFWATINYIHHNPVKHGHVGKWTDWKWSGAAEYIERIGREEAERRWRECPLQFFGKGWDD